MSAVRLTSFAFLGAASAFKNKRSRQMPYLPREHIFAQVSFEVQGRGETLGDSRQHLSITWSRHSGTRKRGLRLLRADCLGSLGSVGSSGCQDISCYVTENDRFHRAKMILLYLTTKFYRNSFVERSYYNGRYTRSADESPCKRGGACTLFLRMQQVRPLSGWQRTMKNIVCQGCSYRKIRP